MGCPFLRERGLMGLLEASGGGAVGPQNEEGHVMRVHCGRQGVALGVGGRALVRAYRNTPILIAINECNE